MAHLRAQDHDGLLEGFQDRERRRPTARHGERMSWSKGFNKRALDNPEELAAARATVVNQNGEEAAAQFDVACKAAKTVIESGAVGSETKDFSIYLSGHSNPSHEPTPGWSNDTVTVSITQVSVPATAGV